MAVDGEGKKVWSRELDIYGKTKEEKGQINFVPFLYQGQYFDEETGLAYNRFRYYSPDSGTYISQDPIGLAGGMPNMYSYVHDPNSWIDPLGLEREPIMFLSEGGGVIHPKTTGASNPNGVFSIDATGSYFDDRKALANAANMNDPGKNWRAHHIDYDPKTNTMRMQFVHQDYHSHPHVGGADEFKKATGFKYGSDDAIAEANKRNKAKIKPSCKG